MLACGARGDPHTSTAVSIWSRVRRDLSLSIQV
jgi:hypothetical protein